MYNTNNQNIQILISKALSKWLTKQIKIIHMMQLCKELLINKIANA